MRRADDEAKRIGSAGAWTMALLGVMGVFFWGVVLRRIFRTLVRPLDEIQRVFEAQTNGEYRRRVLLGNIGSEMNELAGLINRMLDARLDISNREQREGERAALLHLLDTIPSPAGIVTPGGVLAASNRAMESMLNESGPDQHGLPDFRAIPDALSSEWSIQTVNSPGWMIVQKIPSTPSASQLQLTPVSPSP
jgi:HAMP domain-containing protein